MREYNEQTLAMQIILKHQSIRTQRTYSFDDIDVLFKGRMEHIRQYSLENSLSVIRKFPLPYLAPKQKSSLSVTFWTSSQFFSGVVYGIVLHSTTMMHKHK